MGTKNPVLVKLKDIRYKYGDLAVSYFTKNPACECCGEDRISALAIHHTHGKASDTFEVLCHNCHMIHHSNNDGYTYKDYLEEIQKQKDVESIRDAKILEELVLGTPLRVIRCKVKTSLPTIKKVMEREGFVSIPQVGYVKK